MLRKRAGLDWRLERNVVSSSRVAPPMLLEVHNVVGVMLIKMCARQTKASPAKEPNANEKQLSRECTERQRALELIRRRERGAASEMPTTMHGGSAPEEGTATYSTDERSGRRSEGDKTYGGDKDGERRR